MAGLQIPMKSSASSSGSSAPKPFNKTSFFKFRYPDPAYTGFVGAPNGTSIFGTMNANLSKAIADHAILETVGGTQINAYFRTILDAFSTAGNYFANADVGSAQLQSMGWNTTAGGYSGGPYTWSDTIRIASFEQLSAGKSVGATVEYCPAFFHSNGGGPNSGSLNFSNIQASCVVKLMRSSGTLVTIGTLTTNSASLNGVAPINTTSLAGSLTTASFTPQTSQDGDRIVLEITFSCTVTVNGAGSGGSTSTNYLSLSFGMDGTKRQLGTDYNAFRPFQITIS